MNITKNIAYRFHGTPIKGFPKFGTASGVTPEEIYDLIMNKALVDEVLPDGKTVRLDLSNYDKQIAPKCEKKQIVEVTKSEQELTEVEEGCSTNSEEVDTRQTYKKNPKRR